MIFCNILCVEDTLFVNVRLTIRFLELRFYGCKKIILFLIIPVSSRNNFSTHIWLFMLKLTNTYTYLSNRKQIFYSPSCPALFTHTRPYYFFAYRHREKHVKAILLKRSCLIIAIFNSVHIYFSWKEVTYWKPFYICVYKRSVGIFILQN